MAYWALIECKIITEQEAAIYPPSVEDCPTTADNASYNESLTNSRLLPVQDVT